MSIRQLLPSERDGEEWRKRARNTVNQIVRRVGGDGPTADRPLNPAEWTFFGDDTLGKPIWWYNGAWRDATGAAV